MSRQRVRDLLVHGRIRSKVKTLLQKRGAHGLWSVAPRSVAALDLLDDADPRSLDVAERALQAYEP